MAERRGHPDATAWTIIPPMTLFGIGTGALFSPLANLATSGLDHRTAGAGAGAFNTFRQVGGVIGSAAIVATLMSRLSATLPAAARDAAAALPADLRQQFVDGFTSAGGSFTGERRTWSSRRASRRRPRTSSARRRRPRCTRASRSRSGRRCSSRPPSWSSGSSRRSACGRRTSRTRTEHSRTVPDGGAHVPPSGTVPPTRPGWAGRVAPNFCSRSTWHHADSHRPIDPIEYETILTTQVALAA
ncbi:hypothetical protein NKG05_23150 [Oerskovia sp. M15]